MDGGVLYTILVRLRTFEKLWLGVFISCRAIRKSQSLEITLIRVLDLILSSNKRTILKTHL